MRLLHWQTMNAGGFWVGPLLLGLMLIGFGLLIIARPELLAYLVATLFIVAGLALLGMSWGLRGSITYRRMSDSPDDDWPA
jgi:hypothetical protein